MISHPPNEDSLMDYTGYDCFLTKYIFLSQCDTRLKLNEICSIYDICEELFYGDVDPLSWGDGSTVDKDLFCSQLEELHYTCMCLGK